MSVQSIGQLQIEMITNVARLKADMDQAKKAVGDAMESITGAIDLAKKALVIFAGAASVQAFAGIITGAIEGAAALNKLAAQTGATVESLSGMKGIAKIVGSDIEVVATSMNRLSKSMAVANEDSKGTSQAIQALGIDFDKFKGMKPEEQMQAVAKGMDQFADSSGKSAIAMALYGKQGATMIPFLKELAATGELHAKVTAEQAKQAEEFDRNLIRIKVSGEAWKKELAMGMLPALDDAAKAVLKVITQTGNLKDQMNGLAQNGSIESWTRSTVNGLSYVVDALQITGRAFEAIWKTAKLAILIVGDTLEGMSSSVILAKQGKLTEAAGAIQGIYTKMIGNAKGYYNEMADMEASELKGAQMRDEMLKAQIRRMAETRGSDKKPDAQFDGTANTAGKNDPTIKAYETLMATIGKRIEIGEMEVSLGRKLNEAELQRIEINKLAEAGTIKRSQAESQRTQIALEWLRVASLEGKEALEAQAAYKKSTETLESEIVATQKATLARKDATEQIGMSKAAIDALKASRLEAQAKQLEELAVVAKDIDFSGRLSQMYLDLAKSKRDLAAADRDGGVKESDDRLRKMLITIKEETEALTMNKQARDIANAMRAEELKGLVQGTEAWYKYRAAITAAITERDTVQKQIGDFKQVWDSVDKTAQAAFTNIFEGGKNVFEKLRDSLKATLLDLLYQMTVRKWIFDITASVTGQSAGVAGAVAQASNVGSSVSGAGAAAGLAGSIGTAYTAGSTSVGVMAGEVAGAGGVMGGIASALSVIPVWGWAAMAALAIFSLSNKGGGPKTEGGYSSNLDLAGVAGRDIGGNMQGSVRGDVSGAKTLSDGIAASYASLATQLGLLKTKLDVGVFFAKDPSGTSMSQLQITSSAGYNRGTLTGGIENVGRADGDMQAAITLATSQLMLQALKNSDLAKQYKDMLSGLTDSATSADIQTAIARITAAKAQQASLVEQLYQLTATAAEKQLRQREQERAAVDVTNRAALEALYARQDALVAQAKATADATKAAQDAAQAQRDLAAAQAASAQAAAAAAAALKQATDSAMTALQNSVSAARQVAAQQVTDLGALSSVLKGGIANLTGGSSQQGSQFITQALSTAKLTGYLPDATQLGGAITGATAGVNDTTKYSSGTDQAFARAVLAGQLQQLKDLTDPQLTAAQRQVKYLDDILVTAQKQIDVMRGIDNSVKSVADAITELRKAMFKENPGAASAVKAAAAAGAPNFVTGAPPGVGAPAPVVTDAMLHPGFAYTGGTAPAWWAEKNGTWNDPRGNNWTGPSFDVGTPQIMQTGLAMVHKDEAIIPAKAAQNWREGGGQDGGKLIAKVDQLIAVCTQMVVNTRTAADILRQAQSVSGGQALSVTTVAAGT